MPEISITEAQLEALEAVRSDLEVKHVGQYGHVRSMDALQFLLDRYGRSEGVLLLSLLAERLTTRSYQDLQQVAGAFDTVEPRGKESELRRRILVGIAREILAIDDADEAVDEALETRKSGQGTLKETNPSSGSEDSAKDEGEGSGGQSMDHSGKPGGDRGGSPQLDEMFKLLNEYQDKWEETDSEEGKYLVTLPDGSEEVVRTKDDVRAELFKAYR